MERCLEFQLLIVIWYIGYYSKTGFWVTLDQALKTILHVELIVPFDIAPQLLPYLKSIEYNQQNCN